MHAGRYVWKLLYIFMLGYEVDFGHMEALSLISCNQYAEKQVCASNPSSHSPVSHRRVSKGSEQRDALRGFGCRWWSHRPWSRPVP